MTRLRTHRNCLEDVDPFAIPLVEARAVDTDDNLYALIFADRELTPRELDYLADREAVCG